MNFVKRVFRSKKRLVILLILIFAGFGIWRYNISKGTANIKTTRVERGTVVEDLILSGEIQAEERANLNFLSSGELNYVGVKEGDTVVKGQVLAKLDSTNAYQTFLAAEADLRRYEASLDNTYDQVRGHEKDESFSQIETRTAAETNKDKAYRNYVIAQKNMANLSLRAPFGGVIASITHPFNGINTSLAESQIEIVNPASIYFDVSADQTEVANLKVGQKVNILLDSYSEEELEGYVSFIGYTPKVGEVGTVYKVKVNFTSPLMEKVKIGMSGDAKFVLSEKADTLYVPPTFIKTDTTGKYLNLEQKNNKRYVELGVEGEDRVEIKGDIKEGDTIYD